MLYITLGKHEGALFRQYFCDQCATQARSRHRSPKTARLWRGYETSSSYEAAKLALGL